VCEKLSGSTVSMSSTLKPAIAAAAVHSRWPVSAKVVQQGSLQQLLLHTGVVSALVSGWEGQACNGGSSTACASDERHACGSSSSHTGTNKSSSCWLERVASIEGSRLVQTLPLGRCRVSQRWRCQVAEESVHCMHCCALQSCSAPYNGGG
jgi:hypothetical protein